MNADVVVHEEVADALRAERPVVALESAVVTHGLPRIGVHMPTNLRVGDAVVDEHLRQWQPDVAANLQLAQRAAEVVRASDAVPATVAVIDGRLKIGLEGDDLQDLAACQEAAKASSAALAAIMASGGSAGTTVSATLRACSAAEREAGFRIRLFATGGIGGVHRNWATRPDVSTDLTELSRTPVCVVSAGCKSLLDVPATREWLETRRVPVVGYKTATLPWFYAKPAEPIPITASVGNVSEAARICEIHWDSLGCDSAVLLCQALPDALLLDSDDVEHATAAGESRADAEGISGAARTPFVLAEVARTTSARSIHANIALLLNNAALAARVAVTAGG